MIWFHSPDGAFNELWVMCYKCDWMDWWIQLTWLMSVGVWGAPLTWLMLVMSCGVMVVNIPCSMSALLKVMGSMGLRNLVRAVCSRARCSFSIVLAYWWLFIELLAIGGNWWYYLRLPSMYISLLKKQVNWILESDKVLSERGGWSSSAFQTMCHKVVCILLYYMCYDLLLILSNIYLI